MSHTLRDKKRLLLRVRRIQGQVAALERALSEERDCSQVLQQLAAVRGAATSLMSDVFEEHLREHLGPDSGSARQRERELEEVARIVKRYLR
ncbi:MAG: metal/formaldehyde-sensitive transcriptional repressor [Steroidobacteraceae bacterium]